MSTVKTLAWLGLIGWMAGGTYWHVCRIKQLCDGGPEAASVTESTVDFSVPRLNIYDGSFTISSSRNVSFAKSDGQVTVESVKPELQKVVSYLKSNTGRMLILTGYYSTTEENNTAFPNLGLARADALKQYFLNAGIPAEQLNVDAKIMDLTFNPVDSSYGAGFYLVKKVAIASATPAVEPAAEEKPAETPAPTTAPATLEKPKGNTEQELAAAAKYESIFKTMDLYFPLNSSQYIATKDNKQFFEEARKYLKQNPTHRLNLTGHTDSEGPDDHNLRLSKSRAEAVKKQFVRMGIKSDQLVTDGKGEGQPIADNALPAGRKANRRVSIIIRK